MRRDAEKDDPYTENVDRWARHEHDRITDLKKVDFVLWQTRD